MTMVEMIAIEGLEQALLGTAYVGGEEVLAYDAEIAEELVTFMDPPHSSLQQFFSALGLQDLGTRAPVFIFQSTDVRSDFGGTFQPSIH